MMINKKQTIIILFMIIIGIVLITFYIPKPKQIITSTPDNKITPEVAISTDKTIYEKGEIIKINIENRLDKSIWYIKEMCPPSCCNLFKWENNEWKNLGDPMPCIQLAPPPGETVAIEANELKPKDIINKQWDTVEYEKLDENGKYRFSFYYGLIKNDYTSKTVYSNEFLIK